MNNALRSGTFDRGSETQLGGVTFKEILRATSNLSVSPFMGVKKPGRQGLQLILTSVPYIVSYSFDETAKIIKVLRILPQKAIKNYN